MLKKDLGLFLLIVVVGAVVAFLNPRFISPINLENTANLVGLFGLFSIGEGFVIITGGIDLSICDVNSIRNQLLVSLRLFGQTHCRIGCLDGKRSAGRESWIGLKLCQSCACLCRARRPHRRGCTGRQDRGDGRGY